MIDFIKKHKCFIIVYIFILIVLIFILQALSNSNLETIYYITQILGIFIVMTGTFIALKQYLLTSRNEIIKFNNDQIQKSIDLAEYYKNNILCNMILIDQVYHHTGMSKIINKVKPSQMKDFDKHELDELYTSDDIETLKNSLMSDKFCEIVGIIGKDHGIDVFEPSIQKDENGNPIIDEDGTPQIVVKVNKHKVSSLFMNKIVEETLNNLEFFAMHFTYNTADESVVYQSLHKTFLEVVQLLYYNIAINNETGESKFYTNVIDLFNTWQEKSQSIREAEIKHSRGIPKKGKTAKSF